MQDKEFAENNHFVLDNFASHSAVRRFMALAAKHFTNVFLFLKKSVFC